MVVLAKRFDTQSFRTLFGMGGSRRINPSLYNSQKEKLVASLDRMVVLAK
jgi:hypothetical protein